MPMRQMESSSYLRKTSLESIAQRGSGHTPSQKYPGYWNGGCLWLSLADTAKLDRGYVAATKKQISIQGIQNSSAVLHPKNTVVLLRDAGVGKSAILGVEMAVSQHFITWRCDEKNIHHRYLYQWLQWKKPEFERIASGSTVQTIGVPYFKKLAIELPAIQSQQMIANQLFLCDLGAQTAEKLAVALEKRKLGLIQQLLTGRRRLKGFKGEWHQTRADVLFTEITKRSPTKESLLSVTQDRGVIPRSMLEARVTMPTGDLTAFKLVEKDNFVISLRSFQGGLEHSKYRGLVSPAYTVLESDASRVHAAYFRQYFKSADFLRRLSVAVVGIRDGKQINYTDFKSIKLPLPPIIEQVAITEVLHEADIHIALAEQQVNQFKAQKRALMQKLLSGQWRMPADAVKGKKS